MQSPSPRILLSNALVPGITLPSSQAAPANTVSLPPTSVLQNALHGTSARPRPRSSKSFSPSSLLRLPIPVTCPAQALDAILADEYRCRSKNSITSQIDTLSQPLSLNPGSQALPPCPFPSLIRRQYPAGGEIHPPGRVLPRITLPVFAFSHSTRLLDPQRDGISTCRRSCSSLGASTRPDPLQHFIRRLGLLSPTPSILSWTNWKSSLLPWLSPRRFRPPQFFLTRFCSQANGGTALPSIDTPSSHP